MWGSKRKKPARKAQPKSEHPGAYYVTRQPGRGQRPFTISDYSFKGQRPRSRRCSWCFGPTTSKSVVCSNCGWNEYTRCRE